MTEFSRNKKFNSGIFADIQDSIKHSKQNEILLENISVRINYKNQFIMNEPHSILNRYKQIIMNNLEEVELFDELKYRPEAVSEYYYGTPDFWYLILMANKISLPIQLANSPIKIVTNNLLGTILSIIHDNRDYLRNNKKDPIVIEDRIITPI